MGDVAAIHRRPFPRWLFKRAKADHFEVIWAYNTNTGSDIDPQALPVSTPLGQLALALDKEGLVMFKEVMDDQPRELQIQLFDQVPVRGSIFLASAFSPFSFFYIFYLLFFIFLFGGGGVTVVSDF